MTHRDRKLLDLAHDAPCFLQLGVPGCGTEKSVPCHSDELRHDRGVGHKSHDWSAVAGCPACHAAFTREKVGKWEYDDIWLRAWEKYQAYLWENGLIKVA